MGCGDACALYPGKRYEDWDVGDPDGQRLEVVREIRDDIAERRACAGRRTRAGDLRVIAKDSHLSMQAS